MLRRFAGQIRASGAVSPLVAPRSSIGGRERKLPRTVRWSRRVLYLTRSYRDWVVELFSSRSAVNTS